MLFDIILLEVSIQVSASRNSTFCLQMKEHEVRYALLVNIQLILSHTHLIYKKKAWEYLARLVEILRKRYRPPTSSGDCAAYASKATQDSFQHTSAMNPLSHTSTFVSFRSFLGSASPGDVE
jgi:hypothetical protein